MDAFVRIFVVLVLLNVSTLSDTEKTLDDYFRKKNGEGILEYAVNFWMDFNNRRLPISTENVFFTKLTLEAIQCSETIGKTTVMEFASSVANVTLKSVIQDLNVTCGEYVDNWRNIANKTCAVNWTKNWFEEKFRKAMEEAAKKLSSECSLQICSRTLGDCTVAYKERFLKIVRDLMDYYINFMISKYSYTPSTIMVLNRCISECIDCVIYSHDTFAKYLNSVYNMTTSVRSIEPFKYENLFSAKVIQILTILKYHDQYETVSKTREQATWGIIRSTEGSVDNLCSVYKDEKTQDSAWSFWFIRVCFKFIPLQSHIDLMFCASKDQISTPLTWSTFPSAFFNSQCLCLAFNGTTGCGVKAPKDVDPLVYCLSVLLRDFQRQISFRPAVTYLDYSVVTRVPVCHFSYLLQEKFYEMCGRINSVLNFDSVLSVQCTFYGLLNENLNCSETVEINTYNVRYLCSLYFFMVYVNCDTDVVNATSFPFYSPGDSSLVLVLTYVDVSVRLLTLVTYLSCPQLRNLPGKLLIGYQVTALLRLLVVRASLEDLELAVRLDVAFDLSSTLWLTSYLHFLTSSIKTLRLPDSLTPDEARMVLLRYSLLGWALPAALSASFVSMDEAIESHVQFGQILFVLCNYAALLYNLYMFYYNCLFYYDVKKNAVSLKPGAKASTVFTGLFNFALKTSVLSGMGITIRLIFTQIQGLEELLGYYHAFGTLQGVLLFVLYGCNREAREFWRRRVLCLPLCSRRQNTVV